MKLIYKLRSVLVIFIIQEIYIIVPHDVAEFVFLYQLTEQ